MVDEEGGAYCLSAHLKDRLIRSFESEKDFYEEKLEREGDDVEPRFKIEMQNRIEEAKKQMQIVEEMVVCTDIVQDVETPVEPTLDVQPTADLDPLSADDD